MTTAFQGSLLDADEDAGLGDLSGTRRITLTGSAWVDLLPGWVPGADRLFERLLTAVPWRAERRPMYDRMLAVPRLLSFYGVGRTLPDQVARLAAQYGRPPAAPGGRPASPSAPRDAAGPASAP